MSKKVMQDIKSDEGEKRSIRRISIDKTKRSRKQKEEAPEENTEATSPPPPPQEAMENPYDPEGNSGGKKWLKWLIGGVVALIAVFVVFSLIFSGARVEAEPKQESVIVDGQFTAEREEADLDSVPFELMNITKVGVEEVEATGEQQVDRKASGTIIVFNDFDDNPQRLIKNTRFETSDGLIYRIDESIVVPGQTTTEDGEVIPGSIEVEVLADTSGEEYNIGLTDFTIPGLADDSERFEAFYARSKTPMTGGFSGVERTASPDDIEAARSTIRERLSGEVLTEAREQTPEGFILYDDALFIDYTSLANAPADADDRVLVREEAVLYGFIFKEQDLANFIAKQTLGDYEGDDVEVIGIEDLDFSIVDKQLIEPTTVASFDFTLSGDGHIVWLFNETRLKDDLADKHRDQTETVLSGYSSIERAEITLRPFWKRSFPDNPEKIEIERILTVEREDS